jgi:hypothetical protein
MRIRYRLRPATAAGVPDYDVLTQERPRARWHQAGMVSRYGRSWAALGTDASAWTRYRATRSQAVADMLAGRTFLDK